MGEPLSVIVIGMSPTGKASKLVCSECNASIRKALVVGRREIPCPNCGAPLKVNPTLKVYCDKPTCQGVGTKSLKCEKCGNRFCDTCIMRNTETSQFICPGCGSIVADLKEPIEVPKELHPKPQHMSNISEEAEIET